MWAGQVSRGCWLLRCELGTEQGHKLGAPGGAETWRGGVSVCPCNPCFVKQTWKEELALAVATEDSVCGRCETLCSVSPVSVGEGLGRWLPGWGWKGVGARWHV